jgi:hypothetical protein
MPCSREETIGEDGTNCLYWQGRVAIKEGKPNAPACKARVRYWKEGGRCGSERIFLQEAEVSLLLGPVYMRRVGSSTSRTTKGSRVGRERGPDANTGSTACRAVGTANEEPRDQGRWGPESATDIALKPLTGAPIPVSRGRTPAATPL